MTAALDVVVAGGGPAGAAAALTLARAGRRVLLAEAAGEVGFKVGEGLPPAARALLTDLGVLDAFFADEHLPSHGNESAWGSARTEIHDFLRDPAGHGFHLDRARFDATLRRAAGEAGARLLAPARVAALTRAADGLFDVVVEPREGDPVAVRARFLVDATGRAARVARALGATLVPDDRLVAFAALYAPAAGAPEDRDSLTLVESVPAGWWYTALLPGRRRVVALVTDADDEAARDAARPAGFDARMGQTLHARARLEAGGWVRATAPRGGPASSAHLAPAHGEGWVAVGDAALAFDPLSSQGIFTALYGGLRAGQALHAELAGEAGSVARFASDLDRVREAYRRNRRRIYAAETRFGDHPFWRRRHAPVPPAEASAVRGPSPRAGVDEQGR